MRRLMWVVLIGALTLGQTVWGSAEAAAPEGKPLNLVTSPLPINLVTDPGKSVSTEIRIKQTNPTTEKLKITLMKFGAYGEDGMPVLRDREPGDSYFDWAKFDRPVFDAPPNEWVTLKMTINVPKSASFGYYYAVVFTRVGDDQKKGANVSSYNGGTAVLVLLDAHVPGAKRAVSLASFKADKRVFEFLPSTFTIKFANTGNVHVVPHGNVFISQGKKQVASLVLNDAQGNILPGSKRNYLLEWMDGFPHHEKVMEDGKTLREKNGDVKQKLVWANGGEGAKTAVPHLRFGKYTAHLFAVYDDGFRDVPIEAEVDFWVIPWRFLLVVLVIVLLTGLGVYAAVRNTVRGVQKLGRRRK
jgi:hypothetical protein